MDSTIIAANDTTFLDNLRASTSGSHKNLESLPLSAAIISPGISSKDYAHYLEIMLDVIHQTEAEVFPILNSLFPDLEERRKVPLLEKDLTAMGIARTDFVRPFDLKEISVPFALGIFYVVEGSTLGGRFILKNIQAALGFDQEKGAQYFAGYGNKTGSYWKSFLHVLTSYEQQHDAGDEIIAGANYAFRAIHNHFSGQS